VVSLSLKNYTATMFAGRKADAVSWFSNTARGWATSSVFSSAPVPFMAEYFRAHPVDADFGKTWAKLLPESAYLYEDAGLGEKAPVAWTNTFPHVMKGKDADKPDSAFYSTWWESPYSDAYIGALAEHTVDALKLGQGTGTDYLAVSFSALDVLSHGFGPRSHEVQDLLARLDVTLGSLIAHLDKRVGRANYVLALTGDHGVSPVPEQVAALGLDGGRILIADLTAAVEKALEPALGPGKYLAAASYGDLYFKPGVWQQIADNPKATRAVLEAIRALPGVARVFRGDQIASLEASLDDPVERAVAASYYPGRSGDLIVVPRPYWMFTTDAKADGGTTHGSSWAYDRRVPVFLMGQGVKPGQYLQSAGPMDIAPTLAFLCGITLPAADGRLLSEAIDDKSPGSGSGRTR